MKPFFPPDETERLAALYRLDILDTEPEPSFDRITRIAASLIGSPISLISLLDRERQWFKSRVGLSAAETPREVAFCNYAISGSHAFVVLDATKDERFKDNPLVTGATNIRFYAGAPLKRAGGSALGTLCVIDTVPRALFSEAEASMLTELAGIVTDQMEHRLARSLSALSRRSQERQEMVRRKLQEAIRNAQSLFIGGAEPDTVFGELLSRITPLTGSRAGCIASLTAEAKDDHLRVCASTGEHALYPLMQACVAGRAAVREGQSLALPAFHGDQIVGVIGFELESASELNDPEAQKDSFLDSIAGLFVASRARSEGRQNTRAIKLRDRALASIISGVSIVDPGTPGGSILYVNAAFETMSGYRADDLVGKQFGVMNGPDTDLASAALIDNALSAGTELDITLRSYHRNGTAFWNRVRLSPVRDDHGRVEYFVSVSDNVTQRIDADAEMLRAKEAAEKHSRMTSQFMANMSHEIRTPMNGVLGMTALLLDSSLTEEQRDYVETIRSSGEGLLTIINEILDFSRLDSGSVKLETLEFDLCQCIESAMDLVASAAAKKFIELEYLLDTGVPRTVIGDSTRLRQVLINLLGNAVKFTSEGSILLSVAGSRSPNGRWDLHFAVHDTGIGIPEARRADIFKPFQQADNSSTRRYGGTGLGLSICDYLTKLMGGCIWVESEVGRGSVFHFTICVAPGLESAERAETLERSQLEGRRVLVIDPNPVSQSVLRHHLEAWGMRAHIYGSPEEVVSTNGTPRFDLAIVDNDITGLSLDQITSLTGNTPLLALCSLGRRNCGLAEQLRGKSSPRSRLHSKPIKPSYLCETLAAFLSGEPVRVAQSSQPYTPDPEFAGRLPFSILVVEDNPINQKVVLLLLSRLGYRAETANDGAEAVRALQNRRYDIVFMDMHMPQMDGVEATRRIRDLLPAQEQPWIVALTANAMQSDREACLRAGMQAFVTKPVQSIDLRNALLDVKRDRDLASIASEKSPDGDWVIPDYIAELLAESPEMVTELIGLFTAQTGPKLMELRESVVTTHMEKARKILHGLKGSCAQMGAIAMANSCALMETDIDLLSVEERLQRTSVIDDCYERLTVRMNADGACSAAKIS